MRGGRQHPATPKRNLAGKGRKKSAIPSVPFSHIPPPETLEPKKTEAIFISMFILGALLSYPAVITPESVQ